MILPFDVSELLVGVLERRIGEHLDLYAADRGKSKVPPVPTIDYLSEPNGRFREQTAPIVLLGTEIAQKPDDAGDGDLRFWWEIYVEVHVEGRSRRDVLRRRDLYAAAALECLLQRVPIQEPSIIDSIEFANQAATDGKVQGASGVLGVSVFTMLASSPAAMSMNRLPPDDSMLPPGSLGGPAIPGHAPVTSVELQGITDEIDREAPHA